MVPTQNLLLDSLSVSCRGALLAHAQSVPLPVRMALYEPETLPLYAYFPTAGVASVVGVGEGGESVEVEVIGREGLVGAVHLLGPARVTTQCFMQVPGAGLRVRMGELQRMFKDSAELRGRMLEFVQVQLVTLDQIAGCHRMHGAEQRLARWLLMVADRTADRATEGTLELTQEFLAEMLGAQRTTMSGVASEMQRLGAIEYSRGRIRIMDRSRLERVACGCYRVCRELFHGLYAEAGEGENGLDARALVE